MKHSSKVLSVATVIGVVTVGIMAMIPPVPDLVAPVGIMEAAVKNPPVPASTVYTMHGSGVFITPTRFLTAGHVLDMVNDKTIARIRMEDGNLYTIVGTHKIDGFDAGYADIDPSRPYKGDIPKVSCDAESRGAELINVGNPLSLEFIESRVTVTGGHPVVEVTQNDGLKVDPPADEAPSAKKEKFKRHMPDGGSTPAPQEPVVQEEKPNLNGGVFFQGTALPGQSGSPLYNQSGDIVGILVLTIIDPRSNSYTGLGLYVATHAMCHELQDAVK